MAIGEICNREVVFARKDESVLSAAVLMREHHVGSLVVVDAAGTLVGLVAADDMLELLAEEMSALAAVVAREQRREQAQRRASP
jgi:CBS domain-containing protein